MVKTRKIPMRMCVGCRARKPKKELLRVVRSKDGLVKLDFTSKASGRGAYLCIDNIDCLKKSMKSKALDRMLETSIGEGIYKELMGQYEEHDQQ